MPFQKGNKLGGRRPASQTKAPAAGVRGAKQPAGELQMSGTADENAFANEVASILNTPIVRGGGVSAARVDEDEDDDDRSGYAQQSYVNDPVHEEHFDTSSRQNGPLSLPIDKIEIDGTEYVLGWQRCKIAGETDHKELFAARQRGWEPVPMDRLPGQLQSFAFKSDIGEGFYISQDCILMMIKKSLYDRNMAANLRRADAPMQRVLQNVEFLSRLPNQEGIRSISDTPVRQTFTGRTATAAVQDAIERGDSASKSQHAIRGFRVR